MQPTAGFLCYGTGKIGLSNPSVYKGCDCRSDIPFCRNRSAVYGHAQKRYSNKTLTGGLALQTVETYKAFIGTNDISFGGNNFELYFEEDDFDKFSEKLKECDIEYVHPIMEHSWGQRVVRFYDPDKHIIEVGENMKVVCKRFLDSGMTPEQAAERMGVPMKFVNFCMR